MIMKKVAFLFAFVFLIYIVYVSGPITVDLDVKNKHKPNDVAFKFCIPSAIVTKIPIEDLRIIYNVSDIENKSNEAITLEDKYNDNLCSKFTTNAVLDDEIPNNTLTITRGLMSESVTPELEVIVIVGKYNQQDLVTSTTSETLHFNPGSNHASLSIIKHTNKKDRIIDI